MDDRRRLYDGIGARLSHFIFAPGNPTKKATSQTTERITGVNNRIAQGERARKPESPAITSYNVGS